MSEITLTRDGNKWRYTITRQGILPLVGTLDGSMSEREANVYLENTLARRNTTVSKLKSCAQWHGPHTII